MAPGLDRILCCFRCDDLGTRLLPLDHLGAKFAHRLPLRSRANGKIDMRPPAATATPVGYAVARVHHPL
jgi:hypothetical protein